jgi:hypothetical protein
MLKIKISAALCSIAISNFSAYILIFNYKWWIENARKH